MVTKAFFKLFDFVFEKQSVSGFNNQQIENKRISQIFASIHFPSSVLINPKNPMWTILGTSVTFSYLLFKFTPKYKS